jgi:hypothetical protein
VSRVKGGRANVTKETKRLIASLGDAHPDYHAFLDIKANLRELFTSEGQVDWSVVTQLKEFIERTRCDFLKVPALWALNGSYQYLAVHWTSYSRSEKYSHPNGRREENDHGRQFVYDTAYAYWKNPPGECECHPGKFAEVVEFLKENAEYPPKLEHNYGLFYDIVRHHQLVYR